MDLHYDHPILLLQHMIWHEGYHHRQTKLALKLAECPISDEQAGPLGTLDGQEASCHAAPLNPAFHKQP